MTPTVVTRRHHKTTYTPNTSTANLTQVAETGLISLIDYTGFYWCRPHKIGDNGNLQWIAVGF